MPDQEDLQLAYERARPEFLRFTRKLEGLLIDLMATRGVSVHLVESRTKEIKSVVEKVSRSAKSYSDPLNEITDLSGLRVIAYYEDEAALVGEIIEEEFSVDEANSTPKLPSPSEFGYRSAHYIVSLNDKRSALPEYAGLAGLKAEIQVRTVLQHAWAAISHKLQYKREEDVPAALRRKLFRLSALFELADDEFISLREASSRVGAEITSRIDSGNLDIPLDSPSVRRFLETSPVVQGLCHVAEAVGFNFEDPTDGEETDPDNPSDLIKLATIVGLPTLTALNSELQSAQSWALEYLGSQYAASGSHDESKWHVTPSFVCELVLIGSRARALRLNHLLSFGWDEGIAKRVLDIGALRSERGLIG
ncbi:MAG: hypothetical protein U1D25_02395 [Hydrogenophaga sp.]|uniref:GTP pyrophosphokinase n=1 Tax=Hydrogenophaga sp. TaxID=1904254 RepID=UPI002742DE9B|nr:hypothetical protein [Hydrogenophaga sp.]MDP2417662.1 hypothetical protein [Hydrogenophaga sp.]MDZ4186946.1 hypothetical protein [Hydrogenophaga sp.]